ncbi:ATP-grasp domain-containing protein [uncultured Methanobrevibacter sp.]|uniref:ATP-grasp domain-containing protein n=1 Tax=uncultured Methanobrevibacter sp. TaxID=253161 RepID=UPI0025CBBA0A|nr:ATP-grasp domain-containing protein [uncultured Methanobrevibacter sp.]
MVRKLDPLLIVAGNEKGVILTTKLSHDLGLLGNPIENLDAMTLKNEMHNRLKEYGIRYIKGKVIYSLDDAIDYYDSENLKEVVIKPTYSSGSASVRICTNREEMIETVKLLLNDVNRFGDYNTELLIQEYINGEEYIVNTVSCEGKHKVTLIWKYTKMKTSDGAIVYDSSETVNELSIGEAEMIEYAYQVADAIGIQYGPIHGEYMIDEKGPVLIEVNCRPCGANMEAEFLNRISGQHETDSILDSYLKPKLFMANYRKPYRLYAYGAIKLFIVPKDIIARSSPMDNIIFRFKSHYKTSMAEIVDDKLFHKTEDLQSSGGLVYLVHEDYNEVIDNINFLRDIEKRAFSLILSANKKEITEKDDKTYLKELIPFLDLVSEYGTGFIITDQIIEETDILQSRPKDVDKVRGEFDFVLINLNKSYMRETDDNIVTLTLESLSKVKSGGYVLIPKNTYEQVPSKRNGMEAIIQTLGLKIEVPPNEIKDVIIASRR